MEGRLNEILEISKETIGFDFTKNLRVHMYVIGRAIYFKSARNLTKLSYSEIGKSLGKNHATVMHAIKMFDREILTDPKWNGFYMDIMESCSKLFGFDNEFLSISDMKIKIEYLKARNGYLSAKLESQRLIHERKAENEKGTSKELVAIYKSLSHDDRNRALLNLRTIKKVSEKLNTRTSR